MRAARRGLRAPLTHPSPSHSPVRLLTRSALLAFALFATDASAAREERRASGSPVQLLEQALEAYLQQDYSQSITIFERVLEIDRRNETAQQGLESARKQLRLQQEQETGRQKPALQAAARLVRRKDWIKAYDKLRIVLDRVPDHPKAKSLVRKIRTKAEKMHSHAKFQSGDWFYSKGVIAYLDNDWFQSIQAWEQVYAFAPDRVALLAEMESAKTNLAEQQKTERVVLYQNIAWDNLKQAKYDEAVKAWEEVLKLDPENAVAQEGLQQTREAAAQHATQSRQEDVQSLSQQAMDAYVEKDYDRAGELWKNLLELDPENSLAQDYLKRLETVRRPASRSSGYYSDSSPSYGSPSPPSALQRGINLMKEERYPDAIESFQRYVNRNPDDPRAKEALEDARARQRTLAERTYKEGLVSYSKGEPQEAIRLWQKTLRIDPDFQKARQALIKTLAETKRR
jgi:tetratricopeptide (TPR) repeat protein